MSNYKLSQEGEQIIKSNLKQGNCCSTRLCVTKFTTYRHISTI